jgi:uncharacterized protein YprB with RNaseH-like and TPR domain
MNKPKILFFDIETSPLEVAVWQRYNIDRVIAVRKDWQLMSVAWQWQGDRTVSAYGRDDFRCKTDKALTQFIWKLFDKADILVAHNGRKFDIPKVQGKFVEHKLAPPSPSQIVDTCQQSKKHFGFSSNSLNDICQLLGIGKKVKVDFDVWDDCLANKPGAWDRLKKYNAQDVRLLHELYHTLMPYMSPHPNVALMQDLPDGCPTCGSTHMQRRGVSVTDGQRYARYQCQKCGKWSRGRKAVVAAKPKYKGL